MRVQNFAALKTVFGRQNARLLPAQMNFGLTELPDYAMFEPHGRPHAYTARIRATLPQDMQTALDGAFALAAEHGIL